MQTPRKDPLLTAARILIIFIQFVVIFAMIAIGIGIGLLLSVGKARFMLEIAKAGAPDSAFALLIGSFALVMVLLGLANRFFDQLGGIVASVREGEPFRSDNARRLTRMGWLSVGAHVVTLGLVALASWFAPYLTKAGHDSNLGFEIEPTGLLLTLIIFILARVFRHGAAMREELEGTV